MGEHRLIKLIKLKKKAKNSHPKVKANIQKQIAEESKRILDLFSKSSFGRKVISSLENETELELE